jgi:hypothetical protein
VIIGGVLHGFENRRGPPSVPFFATTWRRCLLLVAGVSLANVAVLVRSGGKLGEGGPPLSAEKRSQSKSARLT